MTSGGILSSLFPGLYFTLFPRRCYRCCHDITLQLSQREAQVLELRFGLSGDVPMTLEDIGKQFSVTRYAPVLLVDLLYMHSPGSAVVF
jgi:hypothetical protein